MVENEPFHPLNVGLLGTVGVVPGTHFLSNLVEQLHGCDHVYTYPVMQANLRQ